MVYKKTNTVDTPIVTHPPTETPVPGDPRFVQLNDVVADQHDIRCIFHFGNQRCALLAAEAVRTYSYRELLSNFDLRRDVAVAIVDQIHNEGGRFLGRTKHGTLKELSDNLSTRWVSWIVKTSCENLLEKQKGPELELKLDGDKRTDADEDGLDHGVDDSNK